MGGLFPITLMPYNRVTSVNLKNWQSRPSRRVPAGPTLRAALDWPSGGPGDIGAFVTHKTDTAGFDDDILYPEAIPFVLFHIAAFAAIWTGVSVTALWICLSLYIIRIFAIGAGYHRYFSHRAFTTSRAFQFVLACLAQSTTQRSVLWWAAKHRHHHLYSDTGIDVHSPRHRGFFYAHVAWIFAARHQETDLTKIQDFARYPELMWLHRFERAPAYVMAAVAFLIGGWSGLVVGFVWSTVLLYHATFCINSLAHVMGSRRYVTGDDSRNNWLLALMTFGEGWHNNHHAFQSSVRQGFKWWEYDPTFYILTALSWCGVVWDLKTPPVSVLQNRQRLGTKIIERSAAQLAATFHVAAVREFFASMPDAEAMHGIAAVKSADMIAKFHMPVLPTRDEISLRAKAMFAKTVSLDDIVDRAYEILHEALEFYGRREQMA
jgi:stearoyl-CoA desaturase (delta-9 desaturase)